MHVVMIGPFGLRPRGTMSVRALPLAKALVARGHRATLLLPPWQNPEDAGRCWEEDGVRAGDVVRVENLPLPAGIPGWFHGRLAIRLAQRARELRPDVIHTFKPKAYAGLAHLLLHRGATPVVVDTDDWEGPGGWNDLNPYPAPLRWFFTWQERWGLRRADAVTAASQALVTLTWATGGPPERVSYLPNGFAWPHPPVTRAPHERPTLLLYTRFFEFDLARLWRIVQAVRRARPKVRLWVVGEGFFGEEARLQELARAAGWRISASTPPPPDADLILAGWAPLAEQPAHFAQADVALYPFDDTLINRAKCPVKLMDLLAAGVPVVGDGVGHIASVITGGETGVLVPPGEDEAFAAAVLALLDAPARREALGAQAAQHVRAHVSWPALAARAERAYGYALGGK